MVRTKADCSGAKTSGAKAPRKIVIQPKSAAASSSSSSSFSSGGGNPYNPQPTPEWQKAITKFFPGKTVERESKESTDSEANNSETVEKE